ncbi:MAG: DUF971 domain-containing protein [Bdellovibrionota bacterium]|nr:MAG: DUF971 domain-containing protein [Bdellovibrionota bacterium]
MNNLKPREIRRNSADGIAITWDDGVLSHISARTLRTNCPCASCREARGDQSHQRPLGGKRSALRIVESSIDAELSLQEIKPVGNYAITLRWADGHHTGIYDWALLRQLGEHSGS